MARRGATDPQVSTARRLFAYNDAMSNFEVPPKRDVQLKIMVAAEEKAELDEAAEDNDMTTSNLVRKAIKTYLAVLKKRKKKK